MRNEDVIIQTLSSVGFQTAKTAIKAFYRATIKDRAAFRNEILSKAGDYVSDTHRRNPPVVGVTVTTEQKEEKGIEEKSVVGTEKITQLTCPRCGDALEYSKVCSACSAGKAGYRHRYICVCGVSFVTTEQL